MDAQKLVKMANQIGTFFESDPDRAAAVEGVASHLARFWDPRMRDELFAHVDATGAPDLRPLVRDAVQVLRAPRTAP